MAKVRRHTRTVGGRRRSVKAHRRQLQPRRAGRNARFAYRAARHKRHSDAMVWGSLAFAELAAWATMRGTALLFTMLGIALVGLGLAARRSAR